MNISALLEGKGSFVATIAPQASVAEAVRVLAEHNVGALVVSESGSRVDGIVSERDVVRCLARCSADTLEQTVASIMSTDVMTCSPSDLVDTLMVTMTRRRIRHIPVVKDGDLVGIVSIGDVVKSRIGELETDRKVLQDFIYAR